jgi:group II intron reverse transcriptase/maturase
VRTLTETAYIKISTKNEIRNHEQFGMQKMFDNLYQQSKNQTLPKNLYQIVTMTNNIALATTILKSKDYKSDIINDVRKSFDNYQPNVVKSYSQIVNLLVQQSIKQVLEPICEAQFHSHNYGNRAHRTASHAIARIVSLTNVNKLHYSTSIDIPNLYDNVNHGKLLKQLWTLGVRDKKLLAIISKMLKVNGTKGLPHNNILTPLLANVYLNELDWWISDQWETYQTHHNYYLHRTKNGKRYVDKSGKYRALRTSSNLKDICCQTRQSDKIVLSKS